MAASATVEEGDISDDSFLRGAEDILKEQLHLKIMKHRHIVTGGFVNKAAVYDSERGPVFLKYAQRENAFSMFESECAGLEAVRNVGAIKMPKPYKVINLPLTGAMFAMEYMDDLRPMDCCWKELGAALGRIHRHNPDLIASGAGTGSSVHDKRPPPVVKFGFDRTTYFGGMFWVDPVWCDTWEEYFVRHLLKPQFDLIIEKSEDRALVDLWSVLGVRLDRAFRGLDIRPSLLHGDFCTGNVAETAREPVLFDPCCLYGHWLFDFAIPAMGTHHFPREYFPPNFFEGYNYDRIASREPGHETLKQLYMLFAFVLCYNAPYEAEAMKRGALESGKKLVELLT